MVVAGVVARIPPLMGAVRVASSCPRTAHRGRATREHALCRIGLVPILVFSLSLVLVLKVGFAGVVCVLSASSTIVYIRFNQ